MSERDSTFLSRWSRRKALSRAGNSPAPAVAPAEPLPRSAEVADPGPTIAGPPPTTRSAAPEATLPADPAKPAEPAASRQATASAGAAPTDSTAEGFDALADPDTLTPDSDFRPYLRANVDPSIRNAAMRKLFTDPHFNVMDGLDIYIDDYGKPDPIPESMLRAMHQSQVLGLFAPLDEDPPAGGSAPMPELSHAQAGDAASQPPEERACLEQTPPGSPGQPDREAETMAGDPMAVRNPGSSDIAVPQAAAGTGDTETSDGKPRG